jgi:hypothetical protein
MRVAGAPGRDGTGGGYTGERASDRRQHDFAGPSRGIIGSLDPVVVVDHRPAVDDRRRDARPWTARFLGHILSLFRSRRVLGLEPGRVGLPRGAVTVTLDQPLGVVALDELRDRLGQLVEARVELRPDALLLQGADEALGAAVARRLADVGR